MEGLFLALAETATAEFGLIANFADTDIEK
jgi:hypothetical protein